MTRGVGAEQEEAVPDGHPCQRADVSQGELGVLNLETNIEQGFSLWETSSSEWKFFWKHQFALISHNILLKTYTLNFYKHKSLRKKWGGHEGFFMNV